MAKIADAREELDQLDQELNQVFDNLDTQDPDELFGKQGLLAKHQATLQERIQNLRGLLTLLDDENS